MNFVWAFLVGGLICVVGQLLIDLTKLTPARILVLYVVAGVLLSALFALLEHRPPSSVHPAGNPHIEVRLAALSSAARAAAEAEDILVEDVRTRVMGHNDSQVRVTLEVIAFTDTGLEALGRRIEESVQGACEQLLGATGVTVLVRFLPSKTTTVTREVSGE